MSWDAGNAPDGWRLRSLGEVAKVIGGGTPKTTVPGNFADEAGHPWITPADLTGYNEKYISRGRRFLTDQGLASSSAKYMPKGTVLFSSRAPIGYVAIAANPVTTNQGFRSFIPSGEIDSEYLYHALRYLKPLAEQSASGTTFPELSGSRAARLPIAYPSLGEQRAISHALDFADGSGRSALEHLSRGRRAIEHLRLRALAGAYEGAVQADERDGEVPLAELLQEPLRNGYSARPVRYETPFRVLKLTATTTGRFDPRHFKYTDEVFLEDSPFWLAPGDILVQRGNTSEFVGVPAIYEGEPAEFLYPDLMIRVRVRPDVSPRFVWYMLLAPQSRTYLRERATGSAGNMPKINQEILANVTLPRPQIGAQERIVEKLDAAFALGDALERRIDAASLLVERSADAVLAKAFRGELATTDPRTASRSLARGEASSL